MLNKPIFKKTVAALGVAAALACGSAFGAAPLTSALVPGVNQISDDNAELVIKFDQTLNGGAGGYRQFQLGDTIGLNDILVGIVGITSFPTGALGTSSATYNEVTGIYAVQVTTAPTPINTLACNPSVVLSTCSLYPSFGAVTAGAGGLNAGLSLLNSVYGAGTVFTPVANTSATTIGSFFEDATPDFVRNSDGTFAQKFAMVYDGTETQRIVIDLIGANGDAFTTIAPANPVQLLGTNPGAPGGSFGGDTTISYYNLPGWIVNPDLQISGTLYGASNTPFGIWSDSTYTFTATPIPEPGVLALLGLGLGGLAVGGLRRRKLSA